MARVFTLSHLGNRFNITIPSFNGYYGEYTAGQQIDIEYDSDTFSDIMNSFMSTPIANQLVFTYGDNFNPNLTQYDLIKDDCISRLDQAWKGYFNLIDQAFNDKRMLLWNNGNFVNPENGRYFTCQDMYEHSAYFKIYNENDTEVGSTTNMLYAYYDPTLDQIINCNHIYTIIAWDDFEAFINAETAADARQYFHTLDFWFAQPAWGGGDNCSFTIDNGNTIQHYSDLFWYLFGGTDPSHEEDEEEEDPYTNPDSPYNPSDIGGGDGDGDDPYDPGDNIDIPDDPPFSIADTGLMNVYTPSDVQLNLLAAYLWSNNFVSSLVKELYADPMDVLISLGVLPFNITAGGTTNIKVGDRDSGVSSNYPASKYYTLDCGSVRIGTTIGAYTDYAPYTKGDIFIPYVGFVPFDIDAFMGHTVGLKYKIEICTGAAVTFLTRSGSVWQTFACNVMTSIPLSAANYAQMWQTIVGATVALAGAGAVGAAGLSGATAAGEAAEGAQTISAQSGNVAKSASGIMSAAATKPSIQKSNNIGVMAGLLGNRKPFIELHRPDLILPKGQNMYQGYPSYITAKISELTGYNRISSINLVVPSANAKEMIKIDGILKSGFIVGSGAGLTGSGIVLGRNNSPTHQIKKSVEKIIELTGTFRDAVDVMNPVIRIQYNSPISFNYVYIEAFQRAYYVENVNMLRNNIMEITLSVDVLGSFAGEILENSAIIDKSESKYNLYLNDDSIKMSQKPLITNIEFPNGFFENNAFEYVLLVAGN